MDHRRQPGQERVLPASAWSKFKESALVVRAVVPLDRRSSVYARCGDVLPLACWACLGIALIVRRRAALPLTHPAEKQR
jgi:hypothetical protein